MKKRGFTLIELLLVVVIISVLASIIIINLNGRQRDARDARRRSDINKIQTALTLYYSDTGYYPQCRDSSGNVVADDIGCSADNLISDPQMPTYLANIPYDPQAGNMVNKYLGLGYSAADPYDTYQYVRKAGGQAYGLLVYFEKSGSNCKTGVDINASWWTTGSGFNPPRCTQ